LSLCRSTALGTIQGDSSPYIPPVEVVCRSWSASRRYVVELHSCHCGYCTRENNRTLQLMTRAVGSTNRKVPYCYKSNSTLTSVGSRYCTFYSNVSHVGDQSDRQTLQDRRQTYNNKVATDCLLDVLPWESTVLYSTVASVRAGRAAPGEEEPQSRRSSDRKSTTYLQLSI
jgi:hypothetical protein